MTNAVIAATACISVFSLFVPLSLATSDQLQALNLTEYGKALNSSHSLRIAHACVISSSLPLVLDLSLDLVALASSKLKKLENALEKLSRFMLLLCTLIPSSYYLACAGMVDNDDRLESKCADNFPLIYCALHKSVLIILGAHILLAINNINIVPGWTLVMVFLPFVAHQSVSVQDLVEPNFDLLAVAGLLTTASACLIATLMMVWIRQLRSRKLKHGEKVAFISSVFACSWIAAILTLTLSSTTSPRWQDYTEELLVGFLILQICFVLPLSVLPGRFARINETALEHLLNQKQAYVRFVSHEIRSPLSVASAGLEILSHNCVRSEESTGSVHNRRFFEELVQDISEATETAISVVNVCSHVTIRSDTHYTCAFCLTSSTPQQDLLQYESMDSGLFTIEPVRVPVSELIQPRTFETFAKRKSINLIVSQSEFIPGLFVLIDPYRLSQVIRNLVTNACKFTAPGGKICIETHCTQANSVANAIRTESIFGLEKELKDFDAKNEHVCGMLTIKVIDTGVGIGPEDQRKLFKQFTQFNKNELQGGGGSGLGLWISSAIVERHGGTIEFESGGIGEGSTVSICLPLYSTDASKTNASFSPERLHSHARVAPLYVNKKLEKNDGSDVKAHVEPGLGIVGGSDVKGETSMNTISVVEYLESPQREVEDDKHVKAHVGPGLGTVGGSDVKGETSMHTISVVEYLESSQREVEDDKHINGGSFLIVDDIASNRKMLRRMLETTAENIHIEEAGDGQDAINAVVKNGPFKCIFMDSVMNQMHGPEAVRSLRINMSYRGAIIGVTGNALPGDIESFKTSGLDLLLLKPLKRDRLLEALNTLNLKRDAHMQ